MQILTKLISELHPAPYNPRVQLAPGDARYRKLKHSIERFGLVEPLLWNEQTNTLVGGHQRLRILQDMNVDRVEVSVVHLSLEQEKALNILLNNREAQSDWDLPQLTQILEELSALPEPQLAATGFDPSHLRTLQDELEPMEPDWQEETSTACYEIVLRIPQEKLAEVRGELDAIIARYQLEAHVSQKAMPE